MQCLSKAPRGSSRDGHTARQWIFSPKVSQSLSSSTISCWFCNETAQLRRSLNNERLLICCLAAKGFYLKYDEMKTEPNVLKWDVQILTVSQLH